jgi:hypothetical protein
VQYVGCGDHEAHLLSDRHDQGLVDFEQVVLSFGSGAVDLVARRGKRTEEGDAFTFSLQVVVSPLPLIAGDLDREVGSGGIALMQQGARGRHGDTDQDNERNHGPDDFDEGVLVEVRGFVPDRLAVLEDGIEHDAEHADEDRHTDPQNHRVQIVDRLAERAVRLLQVVAARARNRWPKSEQGARNARTGHFIP